MTSSDLLGLVDAIVRSARFIIEIGAADGADTVRMHEAAGIGPPDLWAFEPDPRNYALLCERIQGRARIAVFRMAVSRRSGHASLWLSTGSPPGQDREYAFSSSLRPPKNAAALHPGLMFKPVTVLVTVISLDDFIRGSRVDLIWCDAQGSEGDIIDGGPRTLADTAHLYVEYSDQEEYEGQPTRAELLAKLPGWIVLGDDGGNMLLKNEAVKP